VTLKKELTARYTTSIEAQETILTTIPIKFSVPIKFLYTRETLSGEARISLQNIRYP